MSTVPLNVIPPFDVLYVMANDLRREIKEIAERTLALSSSLKANSGPPEAIANATLTYRHLEDASMRLGKVLQHIDGGVSVYDKATTVGAPDLEQIIAGAIFDFAGALTAGDDVEIGHSKNAAVIADRVTDWLAARTIRPNGALVAEWRAHVPTIMAPANDLAPIGG